jgi:hypothetical protein
MSDVNLSFKPHLPHLAKKGEGITDIVTKVQRKSRYFFKERGLSSKSCYHKRQPFFIELEGGY